MAGREFDIIRHYFSSRVPGSGPEVVLGPGDDCAILDIPPGQELCVSTDTLVEGVHLPTGVTGHVAAARSLAANLSDLAAMGARPVGFTLALCMPGEDERWLDAFSVSLAELASSARIPLVGGNLARGPLSITLTVFGATPTGKALRRSGASVGDDVYVSGWPGEAAAGLRCLGAESADSSLVSRYECPTARIELGLGLLDHATAAIDVSDGLMADLSHVLRASGCGAVIEAESIPLSASLLASAADALALALAGGDDYELCFTAPPSARDDLDALSTRLGLPLTRIGTTTAEQGVTVRDREGKPVAVAEGYQHFRREPDREA